MRLAVTLGAAAVTACALAASASAKPIEVMIQGLSYAPTVSDALPGDTVTWQNMSGQSHTVTADDSSFDSGYIAGGTQYSFTFTQTGTFAYHCIIHRGMIGEIDVRAVTLDPLPPAAVLPKSRVEFSGRVADTGAPVTIQSDTGSGFKTIATANPNRDGTWMTTIAATKSGRYRAVSGGAASETRRLLVINRKVSARATPMGVAVSVTPSAPYKLVALEFRLRDRFGWWIVAKKRLDYVSTAGFRLRHHGPVLARVVLLGPDHWTSLAVSHVLHLHRR
jgi:plastocyanin